MFLTELSITLDSVGLNKWCIFSHLEQKGLSFQVNGKIIMKNKYDVMILSQLRQAQAVFLLAR